MRENKGENEMTNELLFIKKKDWGNLTYKKINTTVSIMEDKILITKKTKILFFNRASAETVINRADIQSIQIKKTMDFWDLCFAIIFAFLGLSYPVLFIGTAICLYSAYGKEIQLQLSNGTKQEIPYSESMTEDSEENTKKIMDLLEKK